MRKVTARAPINIALIKYWGKEDKEKIIPYNSSISITLDNLYTITTIEETNDGFSFLLNDKLVKGKESKKVYDFLKFFTNTAALENVRIISKNYVPTAAGLASSASAFAALTLAANSYFNTSYDFSKLLEIARKGSGSACRSLLGGFVAWEKNGKVYNIDSKFKDFVMISVLVDSNKKKLSSTIAMERSVKTSPIISSFVDESNINFKLMENAIETGDLDKIGELTKKSFLFMHAVMISTFPPVLYMQDKSVEIISITEKLVSDGIYAYPTMDAGPNVKILTTIDDYKKVVYTLEENGFTDYAISRPGEGAKIIDE